MGWKQGNSSGTEGYMKWQGKHKTPSCNISFTYRFGLGGVNNLNSVAFILKQTWLYQRKQNLHKYLIHNITFQRKFGL